MLHGTNHFPSLAAAVRYYARQEDYPLAVARQKIAAGEIVIGKPTPPPGGRVYLNRSEGRYFIEEAAA